MSRPNQRFTKVSRNEYCAGIVFSILSLFAFFDLGALASESLPKNLNFRRILPRDGLPAAEVRGLLQDSRGFMWIGTYDGLVRYDGLEFRTFRHNANDPESLANNVVWNILEDKSGDLWVATWSGLDRWDRRTEKFEHHRYNPANAESISDDIVRVLVKGDGGTLWVGTSHGLNHFDPTTGKSRRIVAGQRLEWSLSDASVRSICHDSKGVLWVGTDAGGLNRIDPKSGKTTVYNTDAASPLILPSNFISAITEDRQGNLWIGTDRGAARLNAERTSISRFEADTTNPGALPASYVESMYLDHDGTLWVGTDRGGLSWFDPSNESFISQLSNPLDDTTLLSDVIRLIYQDSNGDYWIGHFPYGLSYASRLASAIRHQLGPNPSPDPTSKKEVNGVWEDPNGDVWLATDRGLERDVKATGATIRYRHNASIAGSISSDTVQNVFRDSTGRLWIGTFNGGLNLFSDTTGTFKTFLPDASKSTSLPNPHVWRIAEDNDHNIWVATRGGGLAKLLPNGAEFETFRNNPADPQSLNHNLVWFVLPARDGSIWVGTTAGIGRLPKGSKKWERFQHREGDPTSLSHNYVVGLYEDRDGKIWAATEGGGLNRLDPATGKCRAYHAEDGMPSDQARGIVAQDDDILWILTNNGLSRFDRKSGLFHNFDETDGLNSRLIFRGAGLMNREGDLMIGTAKGLNILNPKNLSPNTNLPPVVITGFQIANQDVTPGGEGSPLKESVTVAKEVRVSSRHSVLTFQFAALNYRSPDKNLYSYKLDGFDDGWSLPGFRREATYTGLAPATYTFHVIASNNDGYWDGEGTSISLVVVPMWWQTRWFRGATLFVLAGTLAWAVAWLARKKLVEQLVAANREKALAMERQQASEEREAVVRSLREAQIRYRELLDNAGVGICILQNGLIKQPNNRLGDLLNLPTPSLEGTSLKAYINSSDIEAFEAALPIQEEQGKASHSQPFRLNVKGRQTVWAEINTKAVLWDYRPATLVLMTEVTDRISAEARTRGLQHQLHQSQKLESLGTLAGGIAHDFNNILAAMLGHAELARMDAAENPVLRESLDEILKGGNRAKELVKQILLFSRRQATELRPMRLQPVVAEVMKLLKSTLPATLTTTCRITENAPLVLGDSTQIHQVLVNLCTNSAHAMRGSLGRLDVQLDAVEVDPAMQASSPELQIGLYCRLTVSDTGHGINEATQKRIFEPFFTTKKMGEGTGLGLAVVHGIIQDHNGTIKVQSEPGKGTVFTVLLPAISSESVIGLAHEETIVRGRGETILLVDDEAPIGKSVAALLSRNGYKVTAITNPLDAYNIFLATPLAFDLVVTDLTMPGMTGVELATKILKIRPDQAILLSTGFSDVWTEEKLRQLGLRGLLMKPFDSLSLSHKISAVLGESQTPRRSS